LIYSAIYTQRLVGLLLNPPLIQQIRVEETNMGRSARQEAIVKLREAIAKTSDPKLIGQLTRQLAKLLPKAKSPNPTGRPRTHVKEGADASQESTYVPNGSALDHLSLGEQTSARVVLAVEKRKPTEAEREAVIAEVLKTFSGPELEALEAYYAESEGKD
jgi:hypothetical protein